MLLDTTIYYSVGIEHALLDIFALRRYRTLKILFNDQRADRYAERSTEAGILHIDAHGNLRVVIRSKTYKRRMVASVGILRSSRLAAGRLPPPVPAMRIPSATSSK